jgi:hypothetical protein
LVVVGDGHDSDNQPEGGKRNHQCAEAARRFQDGVVGCEASAEQQNHGKRYQRRAFQSVQHGAFLLFLFRPAGRLVSLNAKTFAAKQKGCLRLKRIAPFLAPAAPS